MTREEILAAWRDADAVVRAKGAAPEMVITPSPLMALSWTKRAADGHRPNIERVLIVVRLAPAPATLDDLIALAICKAVAEAFEPEPDETPEAAVSRHWGIKVKRVDQP